MPQVFHRSANMLSRVILLAVVLLAAGAAWYLYEAYRSPIATGQDIEVVQPILFSHQHHVGMLGFDCRYCHSGVETSPYAGMPPTKTCMNCHSQIWVGASMLEPVRESYRTGRPLRWEKVTLVPDFVYFDHSIHINKGIGCVDCHGRVDQMQLMRQATPMTMQWCLDCHRQPERYVRPRSEVFSLTWQPPSDPLERSEQQRTLKDEYSLRSLTSCSACHR